MLNAKIFKSFDGNALTIGKNRTPLNFLESWPLQEQNFDPQPPNTLLRTIFSLHMALLH